MTAEIEAAKLVEISRIAEQALKEVREYMDKGNYGVASCIGCVALDQIKVVAEDVEDET